MRRGFAARAWSAFFDWVGRVSLDRVALIRHSRSFLVLLTLGVAVGIVAYVFDKFVLGIETAALHTMVGYDAPLPARSYMGMGGEIHATAGEYVADPADRIFPTFEVNTLWLLIVPTVGGLFVGLLVRGVPDEYKGDGTDAAIFALHHRDGYTPLRVTFTKLLASAITVGSGGSSGLEGPIAHGGCGLGSFIGDLFRVGPERRRMLAIAGMAAGVGGIFRAPLGGALFAVEVLYKDNEFEGEALMSAFMTSIISYSVYCVLAGHGWGAIFAFPTIDFTVPFQLLYYALLAVVLTLVARLFVWSQSVCARYLFPREYLPGWLRPALGGLVLALLAIKLPHVLGSSYGYLQGALNDSYTLQFMLVLGLTKVFATAITLGSGGAGGVFAPSLVIGGMIGGAFGVFGTEYGLIEGPGPMILVGMAGFFAAVSKCPVAALIMVTEMTFGYGLLVPLMLVTGIGYILTPRSVTLYHNQVPGRRDSPAHRGDYIVDVLRELRVEDMIEEGELPPMVPPATPLSELNVLFTRTEHETIPVVDEEGGMEGVVFLGDIREHLLAGDFGGLILAADIMRRDIEPVRTTDDASQALGRLIAGGADELPVVEETAPSVVVGYISRRDIIHMYARKMAELTEKPEDEGARETEGS